MRVGVTGRIGIALLAALGVVGCGDDGGDDVTADAPRLETEVDPVAEGGSTPSVTGGECPYLTSGEVAEVSGADAFGATDWIELSRTVECYWYSPGDTFGIALWFKVEEMTADERGDIVDDLAAGAPVESGTSPAGDSWWHVIADDQVVAVDLGARSLLMFGQDPPISTAGLRELAFIAAGRYAGDAPGDASTSSTPATEPTEPPDIEGRPDGTAALEPGQATFVVGSDVFFFDRDTGGGDGVFCDDGSIDMEGLGEGPTGAVEFNIYWQGTGIDVFRLRDATSSGGELLFSAVPRLSPPDVPGPIREITLTNETASSYDPGATSTGTLTVHCLAEDLDRGE